MRALLSPARIVAEVVEAAAEEEEAAAEAAAVEEEEEAAGPSSQSAGAPTAGGLSTSCRRAARCGTRRVTSCEGAWSEAQRRR